MSDGRWWALVVWAYATLSGYLVGRGQEPLDFLLGGMGIVITLVAVLAFARRGG